MEMLPFTTMVSGMIFLLDDFLSVYNAFVEEKFAGPLSQKWRFRRVETNKIIEMTPSMW